jgi:hypothetical protein
LLGPIYQATTNTNDAQNIRAQLTDALTNNGVSTEVSYPSSPRAVSAFLYRTKEQTVVQLVNYDHDIETDTITSVNNLEMAIDVSTLPTAVTYSVTWQRPEAPDGTVLTHRIANGRLNVTVPEITPWSVLRIEQSNLPGHFPIAALVTLLF